MKISRLACLLVAPALFAFAGDDTSLSGKWQVQRSAAGNESQQDCVFTQKNKELTGTCETPGRTTVTFAGTIDGKNVTWTYKTDSPGGPVTVIHKGVIESADKIAGILTAVEFSTDGEFTAIRSK